MDVVGFIRGLGKPAAPRLRPMRVGEPGWRKREYGDEPLNDEPRLYDTGLDSLNEVLRALIPEEPNIKLLMLQVPFEHAKVQVTQTVENKPGGLWYGCGFGWINYCVREAPNYLGRYLYRLTIDPSEMLVLDQKGRADEAAYEARMAAFKKEYKVQHRDYSSTYDWPRVAARYRGVQACGGAWYDLGRFWEVNSGCLWSAKPLKHIQILHQ